jgi:hypothetical protein
MKIARLPKGSVGEAARLFAKEKQQSAINNAKAALHELELVQAEAKQWAEKVEPLLTNDAGRKIAANVELVDQFTALMAEDRPVAVNAADKMRVIHEAIEPIEQALPDPNNTLAVSGEIVATLDDYRKQAKQTAEAMRKLRLRVEHLVRTAEAEAPAATTLKQAMEEREVALAAEDANELKEKLAATRAEATKKRIAAEQEAIRMQSEQEQADILARAEKEKLVARAKSADVKHYLATFLARSYFQPVGNYMSVKYERTNEELPVSYTRIKSSGALDKSVQGLRTLVILASPGWSGNGNWHDRPPWQFDVQTFTWSKSDQEFIQKAQDLLRELGPTLAELKMLAP